MIEMIQISYSEQEARIIHNLFDILSQIIVHEVTCTLASIINFTGG